VRSRLSASGSLDASPCTSPGDGEEAERATSTTLGTRPNPHQISTRGASAIIGIVCEVMISGYRPRLTGSQESMATAETNATAVAASRPRIASSVVTPMAGQMLSRSSQVAQTTCHGPGEELRIDVVTETQLPERDGGGQDQRGGSQSGGEESSSDDCDP